MATIVTETSGGGSGGNNNDKGDSFFAVWLTVCMCVFGVLSRQYPSV